MRALLQIFEWVKEHGGEPIIPFSGILEAKIFDMPDDEKATYLKEVLPLPTHSLPLTRSINILARHAASASSPDNMAWAPYQHFWVIATSQD